MTMLAPKKSPETRLSLTQAAIHRQINWEQLLYLANFHMSTPLWYAQLKKDNLLAHLPEDYIFSSSDYRLLTTNFSFNSTTAESISE